MVKLCKASPSDVFSFLEALGRLGPATIEQARAFLKGQWPPVRSARTFGLDYQLIDSQDGTLSLTDLGRRLLRFTGAKRDQFVQAHWKLQDQEPFRFLRLHLAATHGPVPISELADLVRSKFFPDEKPSAVDRAEYGAALAEWLRILDFVDVTDGEVLYRGGHVSTPEVFALMAVEFLRGRELRDLLEEEYRSPAEFVQELQSVLSAVGQEKDDRKRGELFERFVAKFARKIGFSLRTRNSASPHEPKISFDSNVGGGDMVFFWHHPVEAKEQSFKGAAIACEAKSTEGNVGSKAVGQARNLASKVQDKFPDYLVVPLIVSRSRAGLDPSGRNLAPPDVIHLTDQGLLATVELQRRQVASGGALLLPSHFLQMLDQCVREQMLEPSGSEVQGRLNEILGGQDGAPMPRIPAS